MAIDPLTKLEKAPDEAFEEMRAFMSALLDAPQTEDSAFSAASCPLRKDEPRASLPAAAVQALAPAFERGCFLIAQEVFSGEDGE